MVPYLEKLVVFLLRPNVLARRFNKCSVAVILLVCALLTALSIPYSQTTWNSVAGFVCMVVCLYVCQNASSPSFRPIELIF